VSGGESDAAVPKPGRPPKGRTAREAWDKRGTGARQGMLRPAPGTGAANVDGMSSTQRPRTLAEALRARGDDALRALLQARPDLLNPVPNDLTQLATRAGTRASVVRALERLDRFTLQTAEALAIAPDDCTYETLRGLMRGDDAEATDAALPHAVDTLRGLALLWGDERLRLIRTARDLLAPAAGAPSPTGLGPTVSEATAGVPHAAGQGRMSPGRLQQLLADAGLPPTHDPVSAVASLTELFQDRERLGAVLAEAPEQAAAVLARLTWGPPYGEVTDVTATQAHIRWLLDRALLLPSGPKNVVLPREVALHLRGGRAHRNTEPTPPPVTPTPHDPQAVDGTAAGQAFAAVRTIEELLKHLELNSPPVLRAGGLSVRDLKRIAATLDVPENLAAFWLELAYAAGLLATDGELDEAYAPTPAYDDWLRLPTQERWTALATAWLAATRTSGLVGVKDAKGRALAALGPELDRSLACEVRRRVLELLGGLPGGASATLDALLERVRWERPLRGNAGPDSLRADLVRWTAGEAELLPAASWRPAPLWKPPPRRSRRSCPRRWTTYSCRRTSLRSPPARCTPTSPRPSMCWPTSSRRAARRSTASRPAPYAVPWTRAGPPPSCTNSSPRTPGPRSRSPSPT
jgi:hypothetical protein